MREGKIYLSLADAVALALENNYDIAIARINLDIADTDILRAKAGSTLRGVSTGLVQNTLGGTTLTIQGGGGPGATSAGTGGGGAGVGGIVLSTQGGGPFPENRDPVLTGTVQYEQLAQPQLNTLFSGGQQVLNTNTATYDFTYNQGFVTGTSLQVGFNNSRATTNNPFSNYSSIDQLGLSSDGDPASAAGVWPVGEHAVYHPGEKQPADYGLVLPTTAALHGEPGGEDLLGPGECV